MRATLLLLVGLMAGCLGDGDDTDAVEPTVSEGPVDEPDNAVLQVMVHSDNATVLLVPLPATPFCVTPDEWLAAAEGNVSAELRDDDRGRVLAVSGQGSVTWTAQVEASGRAACDHDPADEWSIEAEPQEGTVEVMAADGEPAHATVLVRWVRAGCGSATLYEGSPVPGAWVPLEGRAVAIGGGC